MTGKFGHCRTQVMPMADRLASVVSSPATAYIIWHSPDPELPPDPSPFNCNTQSGPGFNFLLAGDLSTERRTPTSPGYLHPPSVSRMAIVNHY
jgi:hypothetical protein